MHAIEGGRLPSAERHFATLKALPVFADVSEEYEEVVGAFLEDFCESIMMELKDLATKHEGGIEAYRKSLKKERRNSRKSMDQLKGHEEKMTVYLEKKAANEEKMRKYEEELEQYERELAAYERFQKEKQRRKSVLQTEVSFEAEVSGREALSKRIDDEVKRICEFAQSIADTTGALEAPELPEKEIVEGWEVKLDIILADILQSILKDEVIAEVLSDLRDALEDMDADAVGDCTDRLLLTSIGKENMGHLKDLLDFTEDFKTDISRVQAKFKSNMEDYFHETAYDRKADQSCIQDDVNSRAQRLRDALETCSNDLLDKPRVNKLVEQAIGAILNLDANDLEEVIDACYADPAILHEPGMDKLYDVDIMKEPLGDTGNQDKQQDSEDDDDSTDEEIERMSEDVRQTDVAQQKARIDYNEVSSMITGSNHVDYGVELESRAGLYHEIELPLAPVFRVVSTASSAHEVSGFFVCHKVIHDTMIWTPYPVTPGDIC